MNTYFIVLIDILMLQKLALFPKLGNFFSKSVIQPLESGENESGLENFL